MAVRISTSAIDLIHRAAADAAPAEACGLLFGEADAIVRVSVAENVAADPRRHFEIDPAALFAALRAERAGGSRIAGYWHSHPSGDPRPSATDITSSAGDGRIWLIAAAGEVTAWRALPGGFAPLAIEPLLAAD